MTLVALGAFLGLVLLGGVNGGSAGQGLVDLTRALLGRAGVVAPFALVGLGAALIVRIDLAGVLRFRLGALILALSSLLALAAGTLGLGGPARVGWFEIPVVSHRGGMLGELLYYGTAHAIGSVGTTILAALGLLVGAVLVTGASVDALLRRSGRGAAVVGRTVGRGVATAGVTAVRGGAKLGGEVRARWESREPVRPLLGRRAAPAPLVDGADEFPDLFSAPGSLPRSPALGPDGEDAPGRRDDHAEPPEWEEPLDEPEEPLAGADEEPEAAADEPGQDVDDDAPTGRVPTLPPPLPRLSRRAPVWRTPSRGVLRRASEPISQPTALVAETSRLLEETLGHFGIEAAVTDTVSGPRVTRYELQLAPGTKVSRVSSLRDDLAYALAAREEIRIIAPIPGKQAVGVEVPNPQASMVTLGDIYRDFPAGAGPLVAWLGLDISGKAVYLDIARMPHLLIAGSTGTGKSVCLNAILSSILLRSTPDELRMILIDPKRVELNHYESIPHLLTPVVTNPRNASAVLTNVVREMESRYELMGLARARNLRDWNDVRASQGQAPMPMILLVIDELADLMMVSPAEVEDAIIRLAQKSRAVGIHLLLATQRPSVDVITGMIKANVPSRIAFAVSSQVDSRVILDATGAESLLGSGDMLFRPVGTSKLQRLQGAYVSEEEVRAITDAWRRQGRPQLREELLERPEPADDPVDQDSDDLLDRAIQLVVSQKTASVSLLQRRLGVGYARAGRLVDLMERMGLISGHEGSKPRTVLVGEGDLPRILRRGDPARAGVAAGAEPGEDPDFPP
ncbi:MAG: segregation ATPase FtsK/SpoIIIE, family [Miltoncostaeaceae bacterium]|nr:segregation ATPase FtsK/SpoIIIE, family [Miltoncostaeaceae bacterium]